MPEINNFAVQSANSDIFVLTRQRMLHALSIFPFLSASMLHQAIGTATSTTLWKPILDELLAEGLVTEVNITTKTPSGRHQSYTIFHLPENKYPETLLAIIAECLRG